MKCLFLVSDFVSIAPPKNATVFFLLLFAFFDIYSGATYSLKKYGRFYGPFDLMALTHIWFLNPLFCFVCRYVGISRPGSDATEVSACTDGPRTGERRPEAPVEVAADPAEQRGRFPRRSGALGPLSNRVSKVLV